MNRPFLKKWALAGYSTCLIAGCIGAVEYALYIPLPHADHPIQFYSNHTRDNLERVYIKALRSAKKTIDLSIYSLTDSRLITLLEKQAAAGVKITIHYDAKATSLSPTLQKNCKTRPHTHRSLMHRKLLIIDKKLTLIGSANLTPSSLKVHDNLLIGIFNPPFAEHILIPPQTDLHIPHQSGTLWLLPEAKDQAFQTLIDHINQAKKTIHVALFTFTHPELITALINAKRRGVKVSCILDHYTAIGASRKAQKALIQGGVPLAYSQGQHLFHHKWIYIDNHTLFFGSANWTRAAFSVNSDCLMRLSPLTKEQRKFMSKMWKIIQLDSTNPSVK